MKIQRFLVVLSVFNLGLLVFLLAQVEVRFLGFRFVPRSVEVARSRSPTTKEEFAQASRSTRRLSCLTAQPTRKLSCFA